VWPLLSACSSFPSFLPLRFGTSRGLKKKKKNMVLQTELRKMWPACSETYKRIHCMCRRWGGNEQDGISVCPLVAQNSFSEFLKTVLHLEGGVDPPPPFQFYKVIVQKASDSVTHFSLGLQWCNSVSSI